MPAGFDTVNAMCEAAVADGVTPGLVLLGARGGEVRFHSAFGHRQLVPKRLPTSRDTLYDVASLTKAIVTTSLVMQEVSAGRLSLQATIAELLPEVASPAEPARATITVRDLLAHASGLPAHRPFWRQVTDAPSGRRAVALLAAREPLEHAPRTRSLYSDLGFILLGWLLERTTGARLDVLAGERIVGPLGLHATMFLSLSDPIARAAALAEHTVAATQLVGDEAGAPQSPREPPAAPPLGLGSDETERRADERGRVLIGEVDDRNAAAMGGVAGHAGLFSTAADLASVAAVLCGAWRGERALESFVHRDVLRQFWSPAGIAGSTWRLGWDGPSATGSQAGSRLARTAVGHLAFTGCSLWIDPARETWVALVSNRVHPTVSPDDRFKRFRPAIHDALLDAMGYAAT